MFPQRKSASIPGASNVQTSPAKLKARGRSIQRPSGPQAGVVAYGGGLGTRTTQEYGPKKPFGGKRPKRPGPSAQDLY